MRIIGISGKIGTGKSTTARMLSNDRFVEAWNDFGDEIKRECSQIFNYPMPWNYSPDGKSKIILHPDLPNGHMRIRQILQWWGTDVRRAQDRWHWVSKWLRWYLANSPDSVVVGDVRFVEEAQRLRHMGAWLFRIHPFPGWTAGINPDHESETSLDDWEDWDAEFRPEFGALREVADKIKEIVAPGALVEDHV